MAYTTTLGEDHFASNSSNKMKVKRAAQILSRKMAHLIDIVGENPDKYKMVLTLGPGMDRKDYFSRAKELCLKFD